MNMKNLYQIVGKTYTIENPGKWQLGSPMTLSATPVMTARGRIISLDSNLFGCNYYWLLRLLDAARAYKVPIRDGHLLVCQSGIIKQMPQEVFAMMLDP